LVVPQLAVVGVVQAPWPLQTEALADMSSLGQLAGLQTVELPG
jgi:hypothetical protein